MIGNPQIDKFATASTGGGNYGNNGGTKTSPRIAILGGANYKHEDHGKGDEAANSVNNQIKRVEVGRIIFLIFYRIISFWVMTFSTPTRKKQKI